MKRRQFLSATAGLAALPVLNAAPAAAAPVPLAQISAYLDTLQSVQCRFVQVNPDGSQDRGTLSIKRPGRARFDYDQPNQTLVMVGGGQVAIFDKYSGSQPEEYPLSRTPLNLILAERVQLDGARMVVNHTESDGRTVVVAQDPAHPNYGNIALYFEPSPLRLAEWLITNEAGERSRIVLGAFSQRELGSSLFNVAGEKMKRRG
ncbi:LolA family protein [Mangrovicoccus algicola]|uniref:Outer membrane lipoprotein carrier protein LolA n=1 Tax=Mangrovicoccus algicola TaxID=2771008 RepID=A0A8J6YZ00_9RHOB|nr:outer membrane lipoprotein carrier protein LolA [Mangrovicoccus algicola]MBE3640607.1 outer membrane lipoprotein carrier protein LolA [Mangrovicoccus algicola]